MNTNLTDRRLSRSEARNAATLTRLDSEISKVQNTLTSTGLSDRTRQNTEDDLEILQARRRKLLRGEEETPGYTRFMLDMTAGRGDGESAYLTQVMAGIATQRATLTA